MTTRQHAILSASSADRWLRCPPSALINAEAPDEASPYAVEGTQAHKLAEYELKRLLGRRVKKPETPPEMVEHAETYRYHVEDLLQAFFDSPVDKISRTQLRDAVRVESRVDYSRVAPEGFGTADCIIYAHNQLHVLDFKYGQGVRVDAADNPQLKLYAYGALKDLELLERVDKIVLHIIQPRLNNISVWETNPTDLEAWAENVVAPTARLAFAGGGTRDAGEWCRFCAVKATCKTRAEANLALAKFEFSTELNETELAEALRVGSQLAAWLSDVKEYATKLITAGGRVPGYKLVAGRAIRRWNSDPDTIAETALKAGATLEQVWERKLAGIPTLEKVLGKQVFNDALGELVARPEGKPTLVTDDDPRPELATDFQPLNQQKGEK